MKLSENFTLEELVFSETAMRKGYDNTPNADHVSMLQRLCVELLEPIRSKLGVPIHINSGFRCNKLNKSVGGSDNSAHLYGCAADFVPKGLDLREAFDRIVSSGLEYDQVILECNSWIHIALPRPGQVARHAALLASGGPGNWKYTGV